jgi:O-succinylbenzoate synthase
MRVKFRGLMAREALLLRGPVGWGEFSPFMDYDDVESARWLKAAVEAAWEGFPAPVRTSIPVNATVPAVPAAEVAGILARFGGCTTAKVKVAERNQELADDVSRVAATREVLGPHGRVRIDANGAWSVDEARRALAALAPYDLEYVEQPCATIEELAELRVALARSGTEVLIAADESVRKADDPLRVARLGAADVVVLKAAPLGGVRSALRIAEECGLPVVVSSALDTSVGIAAGAALAGALPDLPFACGLGTVSLMAADVSSAPMLPVEGQLQVRSVDPDRRDDLALQYRTAWWHARVRVCHEILTS